MRIEDKIDLLLNLHRTQDLGAAQMSELTERIRFAVNSRCTCGGKGPYDPGVCPACQIWHDVFLGVA